MQYHLVAFIVFGIFIVARLRSPVAGLFAAMALLPMGTLALVNTSGGFNLLAVHAAFVVLLGFALSRWLTTAPYPTLPKLELPTLILGGLVIYAAVMSQILPRVFAGDVLVVPLSGFWDGERLSPLFLSAVSPLEPTSGNISQPAYFILTAMVFIFILQTARRLGPHIVDKSIYFAATVNVIFFALDFINADALIALFKTANYSIFTTATIGVTSRLSGGFPESSALGGFSAVLFAYLFMRYLDTGNRRTLALAGLSFLSAVLALSSTGFAVLGAATAFIIIRSGLGRLERTVAMRILLFGLITLTVLICLALFTALDEAAYFYLDELIFSKGTTLSAYERGAWARRGFGVGFETYGLGAGLGSSRSSGLLPVLISNIGIPGLVLYFLFFWVALMPSRSSGMKAEHQGYYNAATAGAVAVLTGHFISTTTSDPGILLAILTALAVASKPARYAR